MRDRPYDKVAVGERIRKAREMNSFTQENVAKMIGVNVSHISDMERGQTGISVGTIIALCDALDVTAEYLLFGKDVSHSSNFDKMLFELDSDGKLFIEDCIQAYIKRHAKSIDIENK